MSVILKEEREAKDIGELRVYDCVWIRKKNSFKCGTATWKSRWRRKEMKITPHLVTTHTPNLEVQNSTSYTRLLISPLHPPQCIVRSALAKRSEAWYTARRRTRQQALCRVVIHDGETETGQGGKNPCRWWYEKWEEKTTHELIHLWEKQEPDAMSERERRLYWKAAWKRRVGRSDRCGEDRLVPLG